MNIVLCLLYRSVFVCLNELCDLSTLVGFPAKFDTVYVYKIEHQFKTFLSLSIKNLKFLASDVPLCMTFQNSINLFD